MEEMNKAMEAAKTVDKNMAIDVVKRVDLTKAKLVGIGVAVGIGAKSVWDKAIKPAGHKVTATVKTKVEAVRTKRAEKKAEKAAEKAEEISYEEFDE